MSETLEYNMDYYYMEKRNKIDAYLESGNTLSEFADGMLYAIETLMSAPAAAMVDEANNMLEDIMEEIEPAKCKPEAKPEVKDEPITPTYEDISDEEMEKLLEEPEDKFSD